MTLERMNEPFIINFVERRSQGKERVHREKTKRIHHGGTEDTVVCGALNVSGEL